MLFIILSISTPPESRSRQKQVPDVRARNQQHQANDGHDDPERFCESTSQKRIAARIRYRQDNVSFVKSFLKAFDPKELPASESLQDTLERVLPFWHARIAPELRSGADVLVVAHGNSLRAMVKMLDNVAESDITELNIPTGVPLLYELDNELRPRGSRYLGDPAAIAAATEAVKRQTDKR